MPHSPDHLRSGAAQARNDPMNVHGIPMDHAAKRGKEMGVPAEHVSGGNSARFTGQVMGRQGNKLFLSAGSTGGGKSDTHQIEFATSRTNDRNFGKTFQGGKNWDVSGEYDYKAKKMNWTLNPVREEKK